ncbi:prepilin-type N-terminal cleavage/methylation domain-containing protein [Trinickia dinghuensis]|uniref:Prepilin-type N-terminal cleavage/methylation domain-containing protein n=2 Tax=Trinickia dinghuensis TaxID=2291023 RepID=A0A3D8JUL6_9BURK|nr:prepilin-type N-terminal cleavage/methylation domain-containing protein [Trinickia dinghuensis]
MKDARIRASLRQNLRRNRQSRPRDRERGFTMIEALAALAVAAIMIAGFAAMVNSSLDDTRAQQAALYQSEMTAAATRLIQQNYTALASQVSATTPAVAALTGTTYKLSNYLPSSVQNVNAYGQTPCLLIYGTSTPGALQGLLVTEGGGTIPDGQLGYIAANSGAGGGSIQAINTPAGEAKGAYGSWALTAPNPAGVSCSGTKTNVGHLASLIYYNGTQAQNADYLYRVAVPGDAAANTMQVPIVLQQAVADYTSCSQPGSIAADSLGNVLNCDAESQQWTPQASFHWREPVADAQSLPTPANAGDVRMTLATNRAYTYNGATNAWQALAVDEAGNLALGNAQTAGTPCTPTSNTTLVSTDSKGRVLSCQADSTSSTGASWQTQSEVVPGMTLVACQLIMQNPGANDYPSCAPQQSFNYTGSPYAYNGTNGTYSYIYTKSVTLIKPGIIVAIGWAHLNDGVCGSKPGHAAQISQQVDVFDGNGNDITHTESQGPTLVDDSGGINNSIATAASPGTYSVRFTTNWATYAAIGTPWSSSYCAQDGSTIQNTPVAAGWAINTYY